MDGELTRLEAGFWSDTPLCANPRAVVTGSSLLPQGEGRLTFIGESVSSSNGPASNQGNQ